MPPLFFFHPVETVNGFLLGGGWLAATLPPLWFEAIRPALFPSSPVLVAFSSSFDHARHPSPSSSLSIKIPRPRETIVSWTSTRTTFQGRSIRRLSYFYYRLVPLSRSIHLDKDRGLRSVAKNRRGGKASELLRNASFGGNRSVVVSMGGEEEEAWQSGLGIAEGGRLESWKRVGQSARLTYARCKFLSIVRYDVRWLALAARSSFDFGVVSIRPRRGIELRVVWKSSRGLI